MSGIYHVKWTQSGAFGLNAVVVADCAQEAIEAIGYMHNPSEVVAERMGSTEAEYVVAVPHVVAQESL